MILAISKLPIIYPETDGKPMSESDFTRDYLLYGVNVLQYYFRHQENVYVSGNLFIYYKKGVSDAVVSPDVFVIKGISNKKRRVYKVWEEDNKAPNWVLEVTSSSTRNADNLEKPQKYADMGVAEYFQYDPTGEYLQPCQLQGFRLVNGRYQLIIPEFGQEGMLSIPSEVLGLQLHLISGELRFYDPLTEKFLPSYSQTRRLLTQAQQQLIQAEQQRDAEAQARTQAEQQLAQTQQRLNNAVSQLLTTGMTVEQVAQILGLSIDEVRSRSI